MICPNCGNEVLGSKAHCTHCGAPVKLSAEQYSALRGRMIASMVLGILSLLFAWLGWSSFIALVLAIVGLVLGVNARKNAPEGMGTGMATAGIACSVVGIVISCAAFAGCLLCAGVLGIVGLAAL